MSLSYGQFCPVAITSEILCTRWTTLVVRELMCGSTRFNQIRRGVPLMSPTLLSKRLTELSDHGVIQIKHVKGNMVEYHLSSVSQNHESMVRAEPICRGATANATTELWVIEQR